MHRSPASQPSRSPMHTNSRAQSTRLVRGLSGRSLETGGALHRSQRLPAAFLPPRSMGKAVASRRWTPGNCVTGNCGRSGLLVGRSRPTCGGPYLGQAKGFLIARSEGNCRVACSLGATLGVSYRIVWQREQREHGCGPHQPNQKSSEHNSKSLLDPGHPFDVVD